MPSYVEALLQRLQNPNSTQDDFDLNEAKRRFNNASSAQQERYLRRGGTMTWVLQEIEKHNRVRSGKAAKSRRCISNSTTHYHKCSMPHQRTCQPKIISGN